MYLTNKVNLYEMANVRSKEIELPVNIWLDENKNYVAGRLAKRIKFQLNYDTKIRKDLLASMDLNGNVIEKTLKNKIGIEITNNDIKKVSNFVKNNNYAISLLADAKISIKKFFDVVITGGELVSSEKLQKQIDTLNNVDESINIYESTNSQIELVEIDNEIYEGAYNYDQWLDITEDEVDDEITYVFNEYVWIQENKNLFNDILNYAKKDFENGVDTYTIVDKMYEDCYKLCEALVKEYIENEAPLDYVDIQMIAEFLMYKLLKVEQ